LEDFLLHKSYEACYRPQDFQRVLNNASPLEVLQHQDYGKSKE